MVYDSVCGDCANYYYMGLEVGEIVEIKVRLESGVV